MQTASLRAGLRIGSQFSMMPNCYLKGSCPSSGNLRISSMSVHPSLVGSPLHFSIQNPICRRHFSATESGTPCIASKCERNPLTLIATSLSKSTTRCFHFSGNFPPVFFPVLIKYTYWPGRAGWGSSGPRKRFSTAESLIPSSSTASVNLCLQRSSAISDCVKPAE